MIFLGFIIGTVVCAVGLALFGWRRSEKHQHFWTVLSAQDYRHYANNEAKRPSTFRTIVLYDCGCGENMTKTLDGNWAKEINEKVYK